MARFFDKKEKDKFNRTSRDPVSQHRLNTELRDAFYRREHSTVGFLSSKGADFTQEMLHVAARMRDHYLVELCLDRKVAPNIEMLKIAVDLGDTPLFTQLLKKVSVTTELRLYVEQHGLDSMCEEIAKRPLAAPYHEINPALLSTP